jgi:hypothetical protein
MLHIFIFIGHPQHCQKNVSTKSWKCSYYQGLNALSQFDVKINFWTYFWQWKKQYDHHFIVESSLDMAIWEYKGKISEKLS